MKLEELLASARGLEEVSAKAATEYQKKGSELVQELNKLMLQRADLESLIGNDNQDMMIDNHTNHQCFMLSIFLSFQPDILVDTILWVFRAYKSHGFSMRYWPAQLEGWLSVFPQTLSPETRSEIEPYYNWMLNHIENFDFLAQQNIEANNTMH